MQEQSHVEDRRHAYLIMAHNEFGVLRELLADLDDPRNSIYLHIDKKVHNVPKPELQQAVKQSRLIFVEPMEVNWGGYTQIQCELLLMQTARQHGNYAYYHLMTGVTFPLKSQDEIHQYFALHDGQEFIGFDESRDYSERVRFVHLFNEIGKQNSSGKRLLYGVRSKTIALQKRIGYIRPAAYGLTVKKGLVYWSLTQKAIDYLLNHEKEIYHLCKDSLCGDEVFAHTFLANSTLAKHIFRGESELKSCLRFVKPPISYHTAKVGRIRENVINVNDIPALLQGDELFAYKFGGPQAIETIHQIKRNR